MEYKEIKKIMDDMGESKLNEIEIEYPDGTKIKIKKDSNNLSQNMKPVIQDLSVQPTEIKPNIVTEKQQKETKEGKYITSPMVGTFYAKPSPNAKPFVEIGTKVKKGDKLCIIEAMKLMNEIESEWDGEIAEILVNNEEIVDYGKKLFKIV